MYLMNKVRQLGDETCYEVIDYAITNPNRIRVCTMDKQGLDKILTNEVLRDFNKYNGYLRSSADIVNSKLFDEPQVDIEIGTNLFNLLIELIKADAFFLPASVLSKGVDYSGEEVSNFTNIRVSSSSMYVGFSISCNGGWISSKILEVENGKFKQNPFYIAVPVETKITSCKLNQVGTAYINGRSCNFYEYNNNLPVAGEMSPAIYLPLPLFNYLNLQYTRCLNALRFFSDIYEEKGIQSSSTESDMATPSKAITVSSSIKNTSKQRRIELRHYFNYFDGPIEEFVRQYRLNPIEHYVFAVLSKIKTPETSDEVFKTMKSLKGYRGLYSLALMSLRCQVFMNSEYFFPEYHSSVAARGGGGGDEFITIIANNNY